MKGIGVSHGIGIGKAVVMEEKKAIVKKSIIADAEAEKIRFENALEEFTTKTNALAQNVAEKTGEKEAEILRGQIMIMQDPTIQEEILSMIESEKVCAEYTVAEICRKYAGIFSVMEDELMKQRAADLKDIESRMVKILLRLEEVNIADVEEGSILVADEMKMCIRDRNSTSKNSSSQNSTSKNSSKNSYSDEYSNSSDR